MTITLRPVEPADEAFLLEVYRSTRTEELALLPWSEEQKNAFVLGQFNAQQQHYQKIYPDANHDIILANDREVGRLRIYVESFNPSMRLFERLGFLPTEEHGIHLLMEWSRLKSDG